MNFWGWRQGTCAVFISVLVTACVPVQNATPDLISTPMAVTLTLFKPPGGSPTPRMPRILTATPAFQATTLDLLPPRCDDLLNGGVQCVGVLRNPNPQAFGWVVIHAEGIGESEKFPAQSAALEQHIIPAGTDAPYRLLLNDPAQTVILSLEMIPMLDGWVALDVTDERGQLTADGYQVTARLLNPTLMTVTDGRAVVMLFDGDVLLSYRVMSLGDLQAGADLDMSVFWTGVSGESLRHTVSAIGWSA